MVVIPKELLLLAAANLVVCTAIGWACICRLNSNRSRSHLLYRAKYCALMVGATASGLSPILFSEWPTWPDVTMAMSVLLGMLFDVLEIIRRSHQSKLKGQTCQC